MSTPAVYSCILPIFGPDLEILGGHMNRPLNLKLGTEKRQLKGP